MQINSKLFDKRHELIDYLSQLPYHKQLRTAQWQELKAIEKVLSNNTTRREFDFCAERGFNPNPDPQTSFLTYDPTIEILARDVKRIPKLLVTEQFRNYIDSYKPDRYEEVANLITNLTKQQFVTFVKHILDFSNMKLVYQGAKKISLTKKGLEKMLIL